MTPECYSKRMFPYLFASSLPLTLRYYTAVKTVSKLFVPFKHNLKEAMFKFQSINFHCAST